ncbi:MAG TPA: alkaline phosphatase family protein [Candidatus Limnocylindrales bacterium]
MFTSFATAHTVEGTHRRSPRTLRLAVIATALVLAFATVMSVSAATAQIATPSAAAPGDQIAVTGSGFAAGQSGQLTFNGGAVTSFQASSSGAFSAPFVVPNWAPMNATGRISAKTSSGSLIATTTLTIGGATAAVNHATLSVPTQALPGSEVALTGAGFVAGQTGRLSINGLSAATFSAAADGSFSVPFAIPPTTTIGMGLISAKDGQGVALAATWLGVGVDVTGPMVSVPSWAAAGSTIWVDGLFFGAGQSGNLTYNGAVVTRFTAAARGSFGVKFVVPSGAAKGTGRISAKTSSGSLLATTTLTIGAVAPNPTPTAPPNPAVQPTPGATPTSTPTATPTASPTQAPTATPTAMPTPGPTATPPAANLPNFSHVYVIVFENKEYSSIVGSSSAPYINSLISQYGLSTNFTAERHPSEPNYIALTSGGTQGVTDDGVYNLGVANLFDQVTTSGRTWKAYQQGNPGNCFTGSSSSAVVDGVGKSGSYVRKHNPAISYTSVSGNKAACANITNLAAFDPAAANFEFITPNMINDMHDGTVADGDNFLKAFLPKITSSPAFANSVVYVTFDEGTTNVSGGGHIFTLAITPNMTPGYKATGAYTHYSMLRTIEQAWGLPSLGNAASASAMSFPY